MRGSKIHRKRFRSTRKCQCAPQLIIQVDSLEEAKAKIEELEQRINRSDLLENVKKINIRINIRLNMP